MHLYVTLEEKKMIMLFHADFIKLLHALCITCWNICRIINLFMSNNKQIVWNILVITFNRWWAGWCCLNFCSVAVELHYECTCHTINLITASYKKVTTLWYLTPALQTNIYNVHRIMCCMYVYLHWVYRRFLAQFYYEIWL